MIDGEKYNRKVILHCPTCGGVDFECTSHETSEDIALVKCPSCGMTMTKSDLIAANGESIDVQLNDIESEVLNDLSKSLKSALKGSKFVKIK